MDVGVELFSMTKAYNMAGWRLGAVLGRLDVIDRYWEIKTEVDCGNVSRGPGGGAAALAPEGAADVEAMRQLYARRRDQSATPSKPVGQGGAAGRHTVRMVTDTRRLRIVRGVRPARAGDHARRHLPGWAFDRLA